MSATSAAVIGLSATASACATTDNHGETALAERLNPLAISASTDAFAARALAAKVPTYRAALLAIADERSKHAAIINDEVARLAPKVARPSSATGVVDAPASSTATPSTPVPSAQAAQVTSVEALRTRLTSARTEAENLAISLDGYRAGMLASVSAALAAESEVQLA